MASVVLAREVSARSGLYQTFLRILSCLNNGLEIEPWQRRWLDKLAEMLDDPTEPDLALIKTTLASNSRFDLFCLKRNARKLAEGETVAPEDRRTLEIFMRRMFRSAVAVYEEK